MQTVNKSNKTGYESLLKIYRETDLSQEKVRVLGGFFVYPLNVSMFFLLDLIKFLTLFLVGSLASCPDPVIVREALDFILSPEVIILHFFRLC
jgi:puromycin-sensitive aminopeptidase